jgi:thiamine biosynthesis lipoprotein
MAPRRLLALAAGLAAAVVAALMAAWVVAVVWGGWQLQREDNAHMARTVGPLTVMGTRFTLTAVATGHHAKSCLAAALADAEGTLRDTDARMSVYIEASELSRLNAAPPGQAVKLSPEVMEVLQLSRQAHRRTDGAFDVTYQPVFRLWEQAGKDNRMPTVADIAATKAVCGWDRWELLADGARKTVVAKGWAIGRAAEAMRLAGCDGGLVNGGGDIRCFGPSPRGGKWRIAIRNPFHPDEEGSFGTLELADGCVFTSGNYERYAEIGGRRYSHIIDPRTAMPADVTPSVTVIGPSADEAVGWSTALSVLGKDGLSLLKAHSGIEAMVVQGGPEDYTIHQTPGFAKYLTEPIPPPPGAGR